MNLFSVKQFLYFFLFLLCSIHTVGQDIPEIDEKDVSDFSITRNQTFDGPSLWGYMNGGADIYLEYGFKVLRVQEFSKDEEYLKMELYKMKDPLSAFGIYSIKTFKCKESGLQTEIDCLNPYQYQLVYGDYYLSIINENGSEKAKPMMLEIVRKILPDFESKKLILPCNYLVDSLGLSPSDIKMIKGPLGVQSKAPKLIGTLDNINEYQLYLASLDMDEKKQKIYELITQIQNPKNILIQNQIKENFKLIHADNNKLVFSEK